MSDDLTVTTDPSLTSTMTTFTLSTDLLDYTPGSTATFTVTGVNAGDTLQFVVTDIYGNPVSGTDVPWTVTADISGSLATTWYVGLDAGGQAFQVQVLDLTTGQFATANFTDSTPVPAVPSAIIANGITFLTGDQSTATGTGIFPSFVEIQNTGTEDGFNTDFRPAVEDTGNSPVHNHSITLGTIPIVNVGGTDYREFRLDLNESQSSTATKQILLEALQIFAQTPTGDATIDGMLHTFTENGGGTTGGSLDGALEVYNMDAGDGHSGDGITDVSVLLQSWATGSGHSDYKVLIPDSFFSGLSNSDFIYLYSKFSGADGGFEEWSVGPANNTPPPPTPHATLSIDKEIVCDDGHNISGGTILSGSAIQFTYSLFDVGDIGSSIQNINLSDSVLGTIVTNGVIDATLALTHTITFSGDSNNNGKLDFGENWVYTVSDLSVAGNYTNTASVTGTDVNGGATLTQDSLAATYFGATAAINIEKLVSVDGGVNWWFKADDADDTIANIAALTGIDPTHLHIETSTTFPTTIVGAPVMYEVVVTNGTDGGLSETITTLTDSTGLTFTFDHATLASGESEVSNIVTTTATTGLVTNTVDITGTVTDDCGDTASPTDSDSVNFTGLAPTLAGLTKGYWATHLTLWDVGTGDEKGAGSELNVTPQYNWDHSGGITLSAVTPSGPSSNLGLVKGANNGGGDSGLLLGDLNHNGLVDDTTDLFLDLASAQALANSSVSGDARIILASQLVAAQLNEYNDIVFDGGPSHIASGFDASPTGLIEEAVQWLKGLGPLSNGHSKINFSTTNDLASPACQAIINDSAGTDYTLSGGAITFKSASMSSSDASWTKYATVLNSFAPGTDISGNAIPDGSDVNGLFNAVQADGEGLKNALAAYNHGLNGTAGFVISTDGTLIGWQDSLGGTVYDVHQNTTDAFWGILEDQNLLGHTIAGITGVHV
jgi:hypothetical protein